MDANFYCDMRMHWKRWMTWFTGGWLDGALDTVAGLVGYSVVVIVVLVISFSASYGLTIRGLRRRRILHAPIQTQESPICAVDSPSTAGASNDATRPQSRDEFEVAIICALELEADAVEHVFDCFWDEEGDPYKKAARDTNHYRTGKIGDDNVVLLVLSGMGKVNAATAASDLLSSYRNVRLALVVGVCGGVPSPEALRDKDPAEILLGDVVISRDIVQFDFGTQYPTGFKVRQEIHHRLGRASRDVRALLNSLQTRHGKDRLERMADSTLRELQRSEAERKEKGETNTIRYGFLGSSEDKLFSSTHIHRHRISATCKCSFQDVCEAAITSTCKDIGCDEGQLVKRRGRLLEKQRLERMENNEMRLRAQRPAVHIGAMASSDTVMKSAQDRDRVATSHGVVAFEMEGAGVWDTPELSCLVIKGVCDYADSHKNKQWQHFAAATAAATMKALLKLRATPESRLSEIVATREAHVRVVTNLQENNRILREVVAAQSSATVALASQSSATVTLASSTGVVAGGIVGGVVGGVVGSVVTTSIQSAQKQNSQNSEAPREDSTQPNTPYTRKQKQRKVDGDHSDTEESEKEDKEDKKTHVDIQSLVAVTTNQHAPHSEFKSSKENNRGEREAMKNKAKTRSNKRQQTTDKGYNKPTSTERDPATPKSNQNTPSDGSSPSHESSYKKDSSKRSGQYDSPNINRTSDYCDSEEHPELSPNGWMYRGSNNTCPSRIESSRPSSNSPTVIYSQNNSTNSTQSSASGWIYSSLSSALSSSTISSEPHDQYSSRDSSSQHSMALNQDVCANLGRNGKSRFTVWYCDNCLYGPNSCDLDIFCPSCNHGLCRNCALEERAATNIRPDCNHRRCRNREFEVRAPTKRR